MTKITPRPMNSDTTATHEMAIDLIKRYLRCSECSWSNGISGAIAEFMYDSGEDVSFGENANGLHALTDRGAIAVNLPENLACFAYEEVAHCARSWTQTIALALPREQSLLSVNRVITALGADREALCPGVRGNQLFDLGLGSDLVRFCVRSGDTSLVKELNSLCGQTLYKTGHTLLGILQSAMPARVVISKLGRIEVYTAIPQKHGNTEAGPHTHLLPQLLGKDRSVIPPAYSAAMHIYPPHPLHDKYGVNKPFGHKQYRAFQEVLDKTGIQDYLRAKNTAKNPAAAGADANSAWYDIALKIVKMQVQELSS